MDDKLEDYVTERNERYKEELELWLRKWLVDDYPARAKRLWSRSYESIEAFRKSVEPNRNRWREILNPPSLRPTELLGREPHEPLNKPQMDSRLRGNVHICRLGLDPTFIA